jgi:hypothetical protein
MSGPPKQISLPKPKTIIPSEKGGKYAQEWSNQYGGMTMVMDFLEVEDLVNL